MPYLAEMEAHYVNEPIQLIMAKLLTQVKLNPELTPHSTTTHISLLWSGWYIT